MEPVHLAAMAQALLVMAGSSLKRNDDEFFKELGLSAAQFEILRILWQQDGQTLGELSQICCCAPPNITGLVDRLEKKKLLQRTVDPQDRRVVRILLTEEGQMLREPAGRVVLKHLPVFEIFDEAELQTLVDLLARLYRHLEGEGADLFLEMLEKA